MARGEHRMHWRETEHLLLIKVDTGIGCGIVADGQIYRGARGAAGDIGHVRATTNEDVVCRCWNIGCLEAIAGGQALAERLAGQGANVNAQPRRRPPRPQRPCRRDPHGPRRRPDAR